MRFYNSQHQFYAGIDLHAREMYICVIDGVGYHFVIDMGGAYMCYASSCCMVSHKSLSKGADLPWQLSRWHSWQLLKSNSVWKSIPDTDLFGSIKNESVSLTPISVSTSPKIENSFFCCSIGQTIISPEPGCIDAVLLILYFRRRCSLRYPLLKQRRALLIVSSQ